MCQGTHNRILHWNKQRFFIKSAQYRQSSWNLAEGREYGEIDRMLKRVMGLKFSLQLSEHRTLGKLFPCSKSQFPHWKNRASNAKPEELRWETPRQHADFIHRTAKPSTQEFANCSFIFCTGFIHVLCQGVSWQVSPSDTYHLPCKYKGRISWNHKFVEDLYCIL